MADSTSSGYHALVSVDVNDATPQQRTNFGEAMQKRGFRRGASESTWTRILATNADWASDFVRDLTSEITADIRAAAQECSVSVVGDVLVSQCAPAQVRS